MLAEDTKSHTSLGIKTPSTSAKEVYRMLTGDSIAAEVRRIQRKVILQRNSKQSNNAK